MSSDACFPLDLEGIDSPDVAAICTGHVAWCCDDVASELAAGGYDPALAELHVLAALARHLEARLPDAVPRARKAWLTWDDIAGVLDTPASTLRRRYSPTPTTRKEPPSIPDPTTA